ncbi:MAG TPA: hypothetical protein VHC90_21330 [Bryobacteraceae bacterium]|nr:hypothetical protein [Bryobacteraceae bacterium]
MLRDLSGAQNIVLFDREDIVNNFHQDLKRWSNRIPLKDRAVSTQDFLSLAPVREGDGTLVGSGKALPPPVFSRPLGAPY